MRATRIADGDTRAYGARNPLRPRHEGKHQTHAAQFGPGAQCACLIGVWNPYININLGSGRIGYRDEFSFAREIDQYFCGQSRRIADSHISFRRSSRRVAHSIMLNVEGRQWRTLRIASR